MSSSCGPSCWLRTYRARTAAENITFNAQAFVPEASPIYTRIQPWEIRVLCIKPGVPGSELITSLHVGQLDQSSVIIPELNKNTSYEALSYSWGYGGDFVYIQCNGVWVKILKNLYDALVAVRKSDHERFVWCDVFCINQTDLADKNVQMQKMFQIYYKAQHTVAWLGHADQAGDRALEYLSTFSEHVRHDAGCAAGLRDIYQGIVTLCSRPWFSRTWVRQEVFAARSIAVQVDDTVLRFGDLKERAPKALETIFDMLKAMGASSGLNEEDKKLPQLVPHIRPDPKNTALLSTVPDKKSLADITGLTLDRALRSSANFDATAKVDFIYGIISMTSADTVTAQDDLSDRDLINESTPLVIDNARLEAQVFADATVYLINLHRSLDMIFLASFETTASATHPHRSSPRDPNLPSWSPSWKSLPRRVGLDQVWGYLAAWRYSGPVSGFEKIRNPVLCLEQTSSIFGKSQFYGYEKDRLYRSAPIQAIDHFGRLRVRGAVLGTLATKAKFHMRSALGMHRPDPLRSWATEIAPLAGFKEMGFRSDGGAPAAVPAPPLPPKEAEKNPLYGWVLESKHRGTAATRESLATGPCWAPPAAMQGDLVVLLDGASLPAILRPRGAQYELIGPLSNLEFLLNERLRGADLHQEQNRKKEKKYKPWPHLGPLAEDLEMSMFVLV